ncbi:MAG: hypothetical protein AAGE94_10775 [Acidobacteriota bacterium]
MNRFAPVRPSSISIWLVGLALLGASGAWAQGQIGFAQKAEDQERKWVEGLSRSDLQGMGMLAVVFHPDKAEIVDGRWSDRQQQRITILGIDFGKADLDLSEASATIDEATKIRSLEAALPPLSKKVKSVKVSFLIHDDEGDTDDKRIKCKLKNRLPITSGTVELYVLEGTERSFWCRDIDPSDAE